LVLSAYLIEISRSRLRICRATGGNLHSMLIKLVRIARRQISLNFTEPGHEPADRVQVVKTL
jgi:hypothetical protein